MKAGDDKVLMEFSDGSSERVPIRDIAAYQSEAKKAGGWAKVRTRGIFGRPTAQSLVEGVADALPMLGGFGGSLVGGAAAPAAVGLASTAFPPAATAMPAAPAIGRIAGGSVGGGAGQAMREGMYRMAGLGDAPGTVSGEMQNQAVLGTVGEGAGLVAKGIGRTSIGAAIGAKGREGLRAIEQVVKKKIPVGFGGGEKATRLWEQASKDRNRVVGQAAAQGVEMPQTVATDEVKRLINEASVAMSDEPEIKYLRGRLDSWRRRAMTNMDIRRVQRIITNFNTKSGPILNKANVRGQAPPSLEMTAKARYMKKVADTMTEWMKVNVPGYAETNAELSASIAAKNHILKAEGIPAVGNFMLRTGLGSAVGGATGAALDSENHLRGARLGAGIGATAMATPQLLSRFGLMLTDPVTGAIIQQVPRFAMGPQEPGK